MHGDGEIFSLIKLSYFRIIFKIHYSQPIATVFGSVTIGWIGTLPNLASLDFPVVYF